MLRDLLLRRPRPARKQRVAPHAEWLEPRLLYSADAGVLLLGATAGSGDAGELRLLAANYEYGSHHAAASGAEQVRAAYALTPLQFEANQGQLGEGVDFAANGVGYAVQLGGGQAQLLLAGADQPVRLELVGAQAGTAQGQDAQATRSNYLVGQDASKWITDIANYGSVTYHGVYDGIDVRYYGNQSQLEYDFVLAPGADASQLQLRFHGIDSATVDANGDLVLQVAGTDRTLRFQAPVSYQPDANGRDAVESHYELQADGSVRIVVGDYDHSRRLVVDPVLSHASYFGEGAAETALGVAVGNDGSVYVTGQTQSSTGMFATRLANGNNASEAYVAKFNADLTSLAYATRVGGSGSEEGTAIAVDASGNAIVTGWTTSSDFVGVTGSSDQAGRNGSQDAFVFKLNAAGNGLVFSTYFGGSGNSDVGSAVAVDTSGNTYVAGTVSGTSDNAFVNKYSASGTSLMKLQWGGSGADAAKGLALDSAGNIYVAGNTLSSDDVIVHGAQSTQPGADDAFLVKYDASGNIAYSTYIGAGDSDYATGVAADDSGHAYVIGRTKNPSASGFATSANAFDTTASTHTTGYLRVYDTAAIGAASLTYSSFIGGSTDASGNTSSVLTDKPTGIAVLGGQVAIVGTSDTSDLPTTPDAIASSNPSGNATGFVMVLKPQGNGSSDLVYGSYYGTGLATGAVAWGNNRVYLVGSTSTGSLASSDGWRTSVTGSTDGLVAAIGGFANNAPVLGGSNNLATQLEDVSAAGTLVADLVSGKISDDAGAAKGIAVIAVDTSHGSWQYSLNNGSNWSALANPASGNALLLAADAQTRVRFVPNADYNGTTAGITFRAWDRTAGFAGTTVAVGVTGGSSAYSTATALASVTVTPVNDAPVRTAGTLAAVTTVEGGATVSLGLAGIAYAPGPASAIDEATQNLTYTVTALPTVGTVQLAGGSAVTLNTAYTLAQIQGMVFRPANGVQSGSGTFSWTVTDNGGTANGGVDTLLESINVRVQNVAPVLSGTNNLAGILEDATGSSGTLVSSLVNGKITDPSGNVAVAITGVDTGNGSWQYTLDNGNTWTTFSASASSSLLLGTDNKTRLRFLPNQDFNGTASVSLRAWDRSSGTIGGMADTTVNGGSTAFSSASATASITVTPVNDAPVRTAGSIAGVILLDGSPATSLGLAGLAFAPGPATATDETGQTLKYTVTGLPTAGGVSLGQVLLADGTTVVSVNTQYTLAQLQGMQFKSAGTNVLGNGALSFSVQDNGGTANGGADTLVQSVAVIVNRAPVLNGANQIVTVYEDFDASGSTPQGNPPPWANPSQRQGMLISDLVANQVTDTAGSASGIAVMGLVGSGTWQYTIDSGNTWIAVAGVSDSSALLLAANTSTRLRFVPSTDWNSTIGTASVTFRAWDQSTGSNGGIADTSWNGGPSAYSAATANSVVTVLPVNDAPVAIGTPATTSVPVAGGTSTLGLAGISYAPGPATATDESSQTLAYKVTAVPTSLVKVFLADGVTVVTAGTSYTLAQLQGMVYQAAPGATPGSGTFSFTVQDNGGTANGGVDTLAQSLTLRVSNAAPVLAGANAMPAILEDTPGSGMLVSDLVSGRITAPGGAYGIAVTSADNANGSWQYSLDNGSNWIAFGTASTTSARLLAADGLTRVRFAPNADWNGSTGFTFLAWDRSSGSAGGTANASVTGGSSAFSTASAAASLAVTAVNDAPVLTAGTVANLTVLEDSGSTSLGLGSVGYGPGGGTDESTQVLSYTVTALPASTLGQVTLVDGTAVATGDYTLAQLRGMRFATAADANGVASFGFRVRDNGGTANGGNDMLTQAIQLTVTPVNDPPVRTAGTVAALVVAEDSGSTGLGLGAIAYGPGGGSDEAGQLLTYTVTALPPASLGRIVLANGTAVAAGSYTLADLRGMRFETVADANGAGSFAFTVRDNGGTANGGNDTLVQSLAITVTPVNDPPVRTAGSVANLTVAEDSGSTSLGFSTLAYGPGGGIDEAGQLLTYTVTTVPAASFGRIELANGTLVAAGNAYSLADLQGMRFTTVLDANGNASFAFAVRDNGGGNDTLAQSLTITVTPVNDPPVASPGTILVGRGGTAAGVVSVSDVDVGEPLTVTLVNGPAHGALTLNADGSYSYTHDGTANYADSFNYKVTDAGGLSSGATVTFAITPVDNPTIARPDAATVDEDHVATGNVLANDSDPDSVLQVAGFGINGTRYAAGATATLAGVGSFSLGASGDYVFTPVADWNGLVPRLTYLTNTGASSTLDVTVRAVNDDPFRTSPPPADLVVGEGSGTTALPFAGLAYSPGGGADEASQSLIVTVTGLPSQIGSIVLADGRTAVVAGNQYTLDQLRRMQFVAADTVSAGSDRFSFSVDDDAGGRPVNEQIAITIVNRAPVLDGANALPAILEDATDNQGMAVADLVAGHVSDPLGREGIAVVGAQASGGRWEYSQDGGTTWTAFGAVSDSSAELLGVDAGTRVRFVPDANWNGEAGGLVFRAWDQSGSGVAGDRVDASVNGGSAPFSATTASTSITVQAVNDAPVRVGASAAVSSVTVSEDQALASLQLASLDYTPGGGSDEAGQVLTVIVTGLPGARAGTVVLADGGTPVQLGAGYTLAQFRGLQFVPAAGSGGSLSELAWVVRDDGGTARGGSDQVGGALRIVVESAAAPAAPVPAPASGVATAPPPPPIAIASPVPAPAPATGTPAGPGRVSGPGFDGVGEALLPTFTAPPLVDALTGFAPERQFASDDGLRPAYLALEQHSVQLASLKVAAPGEFVVTGFAAGAEGSGPRITVEQFRQTLRSGAFLDELNRLRRQLHDDFDLDRTTSITVAGVSLGVSVVYVLWLLRGGVLLGSYLSALPAWRLLDPLPVLARLGDDEDEDDEALGPGHTKGPDPLRGFT